MRDRGVGVIYALAMGLKIRPMTLEHLRLSLEWARIEGWNPGIDDAGAFLSADPDGFLMGWLDNEPVVSISAVAYGEDFGFIGLIYLSHRPSRSWLWCDAVEGGARASGRADGRARWRDRRVEKYTRLGFALAHRSRRFGGAPAIERPCDQRIVIVGEPMVSDIERFDRRFFSGPRASFLRPWLVGAQSREALALVEDKAITGYGVIRDCGIGHKVGPLFAASAADADLLFRALCSRRPGGKVFLDVPEPNEEGIELAERHGMTAQFATARMYNGTPPSLPLSRIFGITSFELG